MECTRRQRRDTRRNADIGRTSIILDRPQVQRSTQRKMEVALGLHIILRSFLALATPPPRYIGTRYGTCSKCLSLERGSGCMSGERVHRCTPCGRAYICRGAATDKSSSSNYPGEESQYRWILPDGCSKPTTSKCLLHFPRNRMVLTSNCFGDGMSGNIRCGCHSGFLMYIVYRGFGEFEIIRETGEAHGSDRVPVAVASPVPVGRRKRILKYQPAACTRQYSILSISSR